MMIKNKKSIQVLADFISSQYNERIIPLNNIIEEEELTVFYDNYDKNTFDGMTIYDRGSFYIHLNLDKSNREDSGRGRFTLAHELGHYFIDAHRMGLKKGLLHPHPSKTNQTQHHLIEREADYFASCLLMPEKRFKEDFFKKKFNFEIINFLSKEYNVSKTACAFRFAEIGNHPIMIVFAENNKIKWTYPSIDFPYKYLLHDRTVPPDTVMGEYFNNNNQEDTFKTEIVWAMDCFSYVRKEDSNRQFYEHCITYKNSALSVFWED